MNNLIFESRRVKLIPFRKHESQLFQSISANPFIRKYLWDDEIISLETAKEIMQLNHEYFKKDQFGIWKIRLEENQKIIGYTGLWYFFNEKQPQIIYAIFKDFTGRGLATEAAKIVLKYAFNNLNFSYLIAAMDEDHLDSQRVAQRLGMTQSETRVVDSKPTIFYRINQH